MTLEKVKQLKWPPLKKCKLSVAEECRVKYVKVTELLNQGEQIKILLVPTNAFRSKTKTKPILLSEN
jgi:hypothetical protein